MKKFARILCCMLCMAMALSFVAVAFAAENTTSAVSIADYAAANGWSKGTMYETLPVDSVVSVTVSGTAVGTYGQNTGKYYDSDNSWRIYQNENPSIVVAAKDANIISVKITYTVSNTGVLTLNGEHIESEQVVSVNAPSITFSVANTGDKTNGQVRIHAVEVVHDGEAEAVTPAPTTPETTAPAPAAVEQLQFVTAPVDGTAYKLGMTQVAKNQNLYLTGEMNGYYYGTTENIDEAADVYVENVEGGFKMYVLKDGVKNYLDIVVSGKYNNVVFSTEGAKVFSYNAECKNLVTNVEGTDLYLGTYNTNTTISASKTSYITPENACVSQYPAGLVAIATEVEPDPTEPTVPETTAPVAPETTAPAAPETTAPVAPETTVAPTTPGEDVDPTGDNTMLFVIFAVMTMAVPAVLVLKKKYF